MNGRGTLNENDEFEHSYKLFWDLECRLRHLIASEIRAVIILWFSEGLSVPEYHCPHWLCLSLMSVSAIQQNSQLCWDLHTKRWPVISDRDLPLMETLTWRDILSWLYWSTTSQPSFKSLGMVKLLEIFVTLREFSTLFPPSAFFTEFCPEKFYIFQERTPRGCSWTLWGDWRVVSLVSRSPSSPSRPLLAPQ